LDKYFYIKGEREEIKLVLGSVRKTSTVQKDLEGLSFTVNFSYSRVGYEVKNIENK
jgi:hypothetical protein